MKEKTMPIYNEDEREDFYILCQEAWETVGNHTGLSKEFMDKLFNNIIEGGGYA